MTSTEIINILNERNDEGSEMFKYQCDSNQTLEIIAKNLYWIVKFSKDGVAIECLTGSIDTMWSVDAKITIIYNASKENQEHHTEVFNGHFDYSNEVKHSFTTPTALLDENKCFNGEVKVQVKSTNRLRYYACHGYLDGMRSNSNAILLIEGKQVLVNREYLSAHSPVFKSIFAPDSVNKQKNKILIGGLQLESFLNFLRALYFQILPILNTFMIEKVLMVADRFEVQLVIDVCERNLVQIFMKLELGWDYPELRLADKYHMPVLQSLAAHRISTSDRSADGLKKSDTYKSISTESKLAATQALGLKNS